MSWVDNTAPEQGDDSDAPVISQHLVRDDGIILGGIVRFWTDGPTYGYVTTSVRSERLGAYTGDDAARKAVERAVSDEPDDWAKARAEAPK